MSLDYFNPSASREDDEPQYYAPLKAHRYAAAIPMLRHAVAAHDDAHAMSILGSLLAMGRGIERDEEEACAWFRQSAEERRRSEGQARGSKRNVDTDPAALRSFRRCRRPTSCSATHIYCLSSYTQ